MVQELSKRELYSFLKKHADWSCNKRKTQLQRTYLVKDFVAGLVFVARLTVHAEIADHHPDVTLSYGKVKVTLTTHSIKSISKKDLLLAGKIDELHNNI